jgi:hypothetical protein
MVRTPFALFDTAPILGVRKPAFLTIPNISTNSANWSAPSYPHMNGRPRYLRRTASQSPKSISALETSLSPSKTIESLRLHRWSGIFSLKNCTCSLFSRFGRTLYLSVYHWYICFKCHWVTWPHCQDAVSDLSYYWPRNTSHETISAPCSPCHHMGSSLLLCKVILSPFIFWF